MWLEEQGQGGEGPEEGPGDVGPSGEFGGTRQEGSGPLAQLKPRGKPGTPESAIQHIVGAQEVLGT